MRKRTIFGIGETILDIIFQDDQPRRATPGGSAFNGLISLGRCGQSVTFISELGNDKIGEMIRAFMQENGLDSTYVDCFPDGKSPTALVFLDENRNASYMVYKDYPAQRLELPLPPIEKDDIFFYGAYYALNEALRPRVSEFLSHARDRKAILYYDPNFRKPHAHEVNKLMPSIIENMEYADIIRGSDEDFFYLFGETDMQRVYKERVAFYCKYFITTHGGDGVNLFTPDFTLQLDSPTIQPVSTIGAGDNFNAGMIYGLLKYGVGREDLPKLSPDDWKKVLRLGIDFAVDVCLSYDNYVSPAFATEIHKQS